MAEHFAYVSGVRAVWHDEFTYDAESVTSSAPTNLTRAQEALVRKVVENVDCASCDSGEDCAKVNGAIGFYLYGDADEYTAFIPFVVSDQHVFCEDCAYEKGILSAEELIV